MQMGADKTQADNVRNFKNIVVVVADVVFVVVVIVVNGDAHAENVVVVVDADFCDVVVVAVIVVKEDAHADGVQTKHKQTR